MFGVFDTSEYDTMRLQADARAVIIWHHPELTFIIDKPDNLVRASNVTIIDCAPFVSSAACEEFSARHNVVRSLP